MVSNRQIVAALKIAKAKINDGSPNDPRPSYICYALCDKKIRTEVFIETRAMIESRLHPAISMGGWLRHNGVDIGDLTKPKLQAHRQAWLDQLIEEFSQKD